MIEQIPLPKNFEEEAKRQFEKIRKPEVTFPIYLERQAQKWRYRENVKKSPQLEYRPALLGMTPCGNGDFETVLDTNQWQGAYGHWEEHTATMVAGILGGPITSEDAHQTWVGTGTDPNVPIHQTAPGSLGAVRIGNAHSNYGCELLSKTWTVTATTKVIKFWYAVVLQRPATDHDPEDFPFFQVRVIDTASQTEISGAVDFGDGTNKLAANSTHPFFQSLILNGETVVYKDWSCAEINLSALPDGTVVTVEFRTFDCVRGGHWGYAYIDNLCGSCKDSPEGSFSFDDSTSARCGTGQLCFNYSLPQKGGVTGSVVIVLFILQDGLWVASLQSPTLTSGNRYCFSITPSSLPGIAPKGFDYVAKAAFEFDGMPLGSMSVGASPDGRLPGKNNDYQYACKFCCPGPNLVTNGDFEGGGISFLSQYDNAAAALFSGLVLPGQFKIVDSAQALALSHQWVVADRYSCLGGSTSAFMVVNGKTCQSGSSIIWGQKVAVRGGHEYRFCAYVKNLRQCAFDVLPVIEVKFIGGSPDIPATVVDAGSAACDWQLISGIVSVPSGTSNLGIQIVLHETGLGDGNDLALDDISLQLKTDMDQDYLLVDITAVNLIGNQYQLQGIYSGSLPQNYGYFWEVCRVDASNNPIPGSMMSNQSPWWTYPNPCYFNGYAGQSTPLPTASSPPGVFLKSERYRIKFAAWSECEAWAESSWLVKPKKESGEIEVTRL